MATSKQVSRSVERTLGKNIGRQLFARVHREFGRRIRIFVSGGSGLGEHLYEDFMASARLAFESYETRGLSNVIGERYDISKRMKDVRYSLFLDEEHHRAFKSLAQGAGVSRSCLFRAWIREQDTLYHPHGPLSRRRTVPASPYLPVSSCDAVRGQGGVRAGGEAKETSQKERPVSNLDLPEPLMERSARVQRGPHSHEKGVLQKNNIRNSTSSSGTDVSEWSDKRIEKYWTAYS